MHRLFLAFPVLVAACLAPAVCLADAGGPVLYLVFTDILAFGLGEVLATGIEFVWLARVFDRVSRWRTLWWAVLVNLLSTYAGAALALVLMPVYFKFFGVGELNPVWDAVWFVLTLIPAYLLTVFVEFRLLRRLQRGRQELEENRLMRVCLAMNGASFIGLALIYILMAVGR